MSETVSGIVCTDNDLTAADFSSLRKSAGWQDLPMEQLQLALEKSLFSVSVRDETGAVIGMGRLVGDGAMYWYVQDVIVKTAYQKLGIGKEIIKRLVCHIRAVCLQGTVITIGLTAARGKEHFYEKFGFRQIPDAVSGAGMLMRMEI